MFGPGFEVGLLVAVVVVAVIAAIAALRKPNAKTARPTGRRIDIATALSPEAAFAKLASSTLKGYALGDSDAAGKALVFTSRITAFSWGFFFPVFVRASDSGAVIETGIKSRAAQWGPIVGKHHRAFADALAKAVDGNIAP